MLIAMKNFTSKTAKQKRKHFFLDKHVQFGKPKFFSLVAILFFFFLLHSCVSFTTETIPLPLPEDLAAVLQADKRPLSQLIQVQAEKQGDCDEPKVEGRDVFTVSCPKKGRYSIIIKGFQALEMDFSNPSEALMRRHLLNNLMFKIKINQKGSLQYYLDEKLLLKGERYPLPLKLVGKEITFRVDPKRPNRCDIPKTFSFEDVYSFNTTMDLNECDRMEISLPELVIRNETFRNQLGNMNITKCDGLRLGELNTLIASCRKKGDNVLHIPGFQDLNLKGLKDQVTLSRMKAKFLIQNNTNFTYEINGERIEKVNRTIVLPLSSQKTLRFKTITKNSCGIQKKWSIDEIIQEKTFSLEFGERCLVQIRFPSSFTSHLLRFSQNRKIPLPRLIQLAGCEGLQKVEGNDFEFSVNCSSTDTYKLVLKGFKEMKFPGVSAILDVKEEELIAQLGIRIESEIPYYFKKIPLEPIDSLTLNFTEIGRSHRFFMTSDEKRSECDLQKQITFENIFNYGLHNEPIILRGFCQRTTLVLPVKLSLGIKNHSKKNQIDLSRLIRVNGCANVQPHSLGLEDRFTLDCISRIGQYLLQIPGFPSIPYPTNVVIVDNEVLDFPVKEFPVSSELLTATVSFENQTGLDYTFNNSILENTLSLPFRKVEETLTFSPQEKSYCKISLSASLEQILGQKRILLEKCKVSFELPAELAREIQKALKEEKRELKEFLSLDGCDEIGSIPNKKNWFSTHCFPEKDFSLSILGFKPFSFSRQIKRIPLKKLQARIKLRYNNSVELYYSENPQKSPRLLKSEDELVFSPDLLGVKQKFLVGPNPQTNHPCDIQRAFHFNDLFRKGSLELPQICRKQEIRLTKELSAAFQKIEKNNNKIFAKINIENCFSKSLNPDLEELAFTQLCLKEKKQSLLFRGFQAISIDASPLQIIGGEKFRAKISIQNKGKNRVNYRQENVNNRDWLLLPFAQIGIDQAFVLTPGQSSVCDFQQVFSLEKVFQETALLDLGIRCQKIKIIPPPELWEVIERQVREKLKKRNQLVRLEDCDPLQKEGKRNGNLTEKSWIAICPVQEDYNLWLPGFQPILVSNTLFRLRADDLLRNKSSDFL